MHSLYCLLLSWMTDRIKQFSLSHIFCLQL
uniref:Uncharacterized protein n=1 Tax=Arundo donax TaxID=35708 RepID=A0A0A9F8S4_ARUDO